MSDIAAVIDVRVADKRVVAYNDNSDGTIQQLLVHCHAVAHRMETVELFGDHTKPTSALMLM